MRQEARYFAVLEALGQRTDNGAWWSMMSARSGFGIPEGPLRRRLSLLVRDGLVELDNSQRPLRWRITQAGRDALAERREVTA